MNIALQELGGGGNVRGAPGCGAEPPTTSPVEEGGREADGAGAGGWRSRGRGDPRSQVPGGEGASLQTGGAGLGRGAGAGAGAGPRAISPIRLTRGRPGLWQMVEYRRATLREDDAPETPVEGGASLDSVEVSEGLSRPPQAQPWHEARQTRRLWAALEGHLHLPPPTSAQTLAAAARGRWRGDSQP